jgi:hypothetical protein
MQLECGHVGACPAEKKFNINSVVEDGAVGVATASSGAVGHCSSTDCFA